VLERQARDAEWWRRRLGDAAPDAAGGEQVLARVAWSLREHGFTAAHRTVFAAALR
jgi:hypothetical protein